MANIDAVQLPDGSGYNIVDDTSGYITQSAAQAMVTQAVQGITKASLGLDNVDNTSDANKPISTAQAAALNEKLNSDAIANEEAALVAILMSSGIFLGSIG